MKVLQAIARCGQAASVACNTDLISFGALAQLGARNIRIVEATGSNPVCSIFCFLILSELSFYPV